MTDGIPGAKIIHAVCWRCSTGCDIVVPTAEDPLRSVKYVSDVTEFSEEIVREWLKRGELKGIKIKGVWRIQQSALAEFVNKKWGY